MQFATLALAALAGVASAQNGGTKMIVVTVGANKTLTYSPDKITAAVGDMVQFQFPFGNHTVTQAAFDEPCKPISLFSNVTGFHSGFQPAAASASEGKVPTFSIQINDTKPIWIYCAQAKHCESGMVMVINENTAANSSRSLENFKSAAAKATTVVPGSADSGSGSGSSSGSGSDSGSGSGTAGSGGSGNNTSPNAGMALSAPGAVGLLAAGAALLML
ncbi:hypothetical protein VTK73DRAFT_1886 [Phialemonium thermophilum]|uniref:Extracellular serine-rich protein n=1 Tax=Phialemonium thermophilum TaxID=223376 RepID=A0ABR3Y3C4_9PEZI